MKGHNNSNKDTGSGALFLTEIEESEYNETAATEDHYQ